MDSHNEAAEHVAHTVEELLRYYDEQFITVAYHTLLGREPDPAGLRHYLSRLRSGIHKADILYEIYTSTEGRTRNISIHGLERLVREHKRRKNPVAAFFHRLLTGNSYSNELALSLRSLENTLHKQNQQIIDKLEQIQRTQSPDTNDVSGKLDPKWYATQYPEVLQTGLSPEQHYIQFGKYEGRAPNCTAFFDPDWYLTRYPDIRTTGVTPREHYNRYGKHEKRIQNFEFLFDPAWYAQQYHDVLKSGLSPWDHYIRYGKSEKRLPHPQAIALEDDGYQMLNIFKVPMAQSVQGSIAIHLHLFYHDLAIEFREYLLNMPFTYDLFVSVATSEGKAHCQELFHTLPYLNKLTITQVPNRGRDIAPMFCTFGRDLSHYDYIAHLHGKKSLYNKGATEGWRQYLCYNLLGSEERIRRLFTLMQQEHPYGLLYPQNYSLVPSIANTWLANKAMGQSWCDRLGITHVPSGYFDFPAGSMFWARFDALRPLFETGITLNTFPEEQGQKDGTFAHCLERLLGVTTRHQKYRLGVLKDFQHPSWSAWRFDQFINRPISAIANQLNDENIKVIAFDIFDTLLVRPLLNPESTKSIVAARIGGESGSLYLRYRAKAEAEARRSHGRDVGMSEIFSALEKVSGLREPVLTQLKQMELQVEQASLSVRSGGARIYSEALKSRKPIILISDMFLPKSLITEALQREGFNDWTELYISNEVGLRKDTGELYEYVWKQLNITPESMLMIGDNERADFQIPCDKGGKALQLLKPIEFARGLPRSRGLIEDLERNADLHDELTLGPILSRIFSEASYPQLDPYSFVPPTPFNIGYSLVGPLLVSFSQWLIERAQKEGIDHLIFLAREGQLLKRIYDLWSDNIPEAPRSSYLVVSRRTVSVASITDMTDIKAIAQNNYYGDTAENFLHERFGLTLSKTRWDEINEKIQWNATKSVEIDNKDIEHLIPLLQMLEPDIIEKSHAERAPLEHYLNSLNFTQSGTQAVVDVGYGATIQGYLNTLLALPVHGYYMMTDQRSTNVSQQHQVTIQGCFLDAVQQVESAPLMYLRNFELEKFLSSNDAQVVSYHFDADKKPIPTFRELSDQETLCVNFRNELQKGVEKYTLETCRIREELFPQFRPSLSVARRVYETFLEQLSVAETQLIHQVALDDHYCGRGVVQ